MNTLSICAIGSRVFLRKAAIAGIAATLLFTGNAPQSLATPAPLQISQRQQNWDATLRMARLVTASREVNALVLQLDVLDKPQTRYANAVYQIFARQGNDRWQEIYTTRGARLIASSGGRVTLPPEVIELSQLQRSIGSTNLSNVELRAVVQLRYDEQGGRRDQRLEWQQAQTYQTIAYSNTTEIVSNWATISQTTATSTTSTQQPAPPPQSLPPQSLPPQSPNVGQPNNQQDANRGHFSLGILQAQTLYPELIARVSLKSQRPNAYLQERFVGDFRYRANQRAQFVRGLNPGDRVVVRLFTPQNEFVGYSEFELLSAFSTVDLVLPSQRSNERIVRTVYGIDRDQNNVIDTGATVYDYFTQVTGSSLSTSRVTFFSSTRSINTSLFRYQGLPTPPTTCSYTRSFQSGVFALVERTVSIFSSNLAPALVSLPGQVVQITSLSTSSLSIYEVSQLILIHREVGVSQGTIVRIDDESGGNYEPGDDDDDDDRDDDDDDDRPRRRCNQGIGNGAEGCDPGNSRPHGGSNDEGGRRPGRGR